MDRTLDQWFATQILPHEAALMRYLQRVWKTPADIADLRQETYVRVYEHAAKGLPQAPRSFLFTTARNLMIDRMRRERVVSIEYSQDVESLDVFVDELSPERRLSARQDLLRLTEAFDQLPQMTRAAIWLRRIEGLSQRQAAQSLGIAEGALEGHMCRGLRGLANALFSKLPARAGGESDAEPTDGKHHG